MQIVFKLPCSDAVASAEFYARLFWVAPSLRAYWDARGADVEIGNGVVIRLCPTSLPIVPSQIEFNAWDVVQLHRKIEGTIAEHDGTVETMPPCTRWGLYEFPGGLALSVMDPDGHYLSFVEW